jgi:hypothetical protein
MSGATLFWIILAILFLRGTFRWIVVLLLLLGALACAPAQDYVIEERPEPAASPPRRVYNTAMFSDRYGWEQSPWYRVSDNTTDLPVYVVVSVQGYACLVDGGDWATVAPGSMYSCDGHWRVPRR